MPPGIVMRLVREGTIVAVYTVLNIDGEECQQPYLTTASDVRHALGEWLGDMGTDADVSRIWTTARARDAITYVEPHGFRFVDRFEPLDYLVTLLDSPERRELETWLLKNDLRNRRAPLGDSIMAAWLAKADENQGLVEVPARWSVTGVPVTFDIWGAA